MAKVNSVGKHSRHKPPSRIRYEEEHPTVSFRVPLHVYKQLQELESKTGKSIADVFKEALEPQLADAGAPYQKGWKDAEKRYRVDYPCGICGEMIGIETDNAKLVASQHMRDRRWGHSECHEREKKRSPNSEGWWLTGA